MSTEELLQSATHGIQGELHPDPLTGAPAEVVPSTIFTSSCHAYTHVDAPVHFQPGDRDIAGVPVDQRMGPGKIVLVPCGARAGHAQRVARYRALGPSACGSRGGEVHGSRREA